ncbi:MAG: histidinol dehydrogenase [Nitrosopumilus sp.]
MKIIKVVNVAKFAATAVPTQSKKNKDVVESILTNVKKNGDVAIRKYEKKFTGASLKSLRVSESEIKKAYSNIPKIQINALRMAKIRLEKTEKAIKSTLKHKTINNDGVKISKKFVPIQSVGCYVPGGLAKYPSSLIMSVVPAKVAGVKRIVVVTPPDSNGEIEPLILVAAKICGAHEIYKTSGVQSIAAMSYGTKTISKVDKIVGPGGTYVTTAKFMTSEHTGIDMLAGPTELGIIADDSADPKFVALDLISQAEHSSDTFCYLITTSEKLAKSVNSIILEHLSKIQRNNFVKSSLKKNGFIAICKTRQDMTALANLLAPEHLQIMTKNPTSISSKINTSGLVLLGNNAPSSASDYLFGSNHILPTNGFGKIRGSLSVLDFLKLNTQVTCSKSALIKISKYLDTLTTSEGLPNHFEAVRSRLK